MKSVSEKPVYFPNLNALRFLAAFFVLIGHIELIKTTYGLPSLKKDYYYLYPDSGLAVSFFFVLSGFLITFLLLKEHEKSNTIAVKKFYFRRFFRIWPLYFLLLLIGFLVFPLIFTEYPGRNFFGGDTYFESLALYVLIFPNVAQIAGLSVPGLSHLWSIGVEEQFYYIWPVLLKYCREKILFVLIGIIVVIAALPHVLGYLNTEFYDGTSQLMSNLRFFFIQFRISAMAMGGLCAYLLYQNHPFLKIIYNRFVSIGLLVLLIVAGVFHIDFPVALYSALFAIFILDISTNPNYPISLENKLFTYLGKISYGLYMYHWLVIIMVIEIVRKYIDYSLWFNVLVYVFSISLTILISGLSYRYFEKYFINLKKRFTVIKSRAA